MAASGEDGVPAYGIIAGRASGPLAGLVPVGDVVGGLHEACVETGRLAGRVEVLLWAQTELQVELDLLTSTDRFADTRALENFLKRVRDSLARVQDGSGDPSGLIRSDLGVVGTGGTAAEAVPGVEMGG